MSNTNNFMINRIITAGNPVFPNPPVKPKNEPESNSSFANILKEKIEESKGVKFSKHAEARLKSRNITIDSAKMEQINKAVERADEKGIKESLLVMDNLALVVSVKNKTVITAVNSDELKGNVFTNIDGAVII